MGFSVSVGVCAHNEENTIRQCLDSILRQKTGFGEITEVIVVSSGSADRTNEIISKAAEKDRRVKLITQERKEGKASALNLYLNKARADVLVLASADLVFGENTLASLLEPFKNDSVGMVTGRPIPNNNPESFTGFIVHLIWQLHHQLQVITPKANEVFAVRPLVKNIDAESAVDDLQFEARVKEKGYLIVYRPDAVVVNHGPESIGDLIKQRKRIIIGYLHARETLGYVPVTMDKIKILSALLNNLSFSPKKLAWTILAVALEICIRLTANFEYYVLRKNPYNWDTIKSTKRLQNE